MPTTIKKKDGKFQVATPGGVKAKGTTKAKAESQKRLLDAIDHGFKPTQGKGKAAPSKPMGKMGKPVAVVVTAKKTEKPKAKAKKQ